MIKKYSEFHQLDESIKSNLIVGLISMSLLNSCHTLKKHDKQPIKVEKPVIKHSDDEDIADYVHKKWGISSGNFERGEIGEKSGISMKPFPVGNMNCRDFNPTNQLPWPCEKGSVVQKFGIGAMKNNKNIQMKNDGLYLHVPKDSKVHPVFQGKITKIFDVCGSTCIIVSHGQYYSVYSGFHSIDKETKVNKKVTTQTFLGYSNEELSFQIWLRKGNTAIPVDPIKYLSK